MKKALKLVHKEYMKKIYEKVISGYRGLIS